MRTQAIFLLFLTIVVHARAQSTLNDYLLTASSDEDLQSLEAQIAYLDEKPYRLSYLQKLEFRTQNRELITTQQEYAIRVNPANPWEVRNNNRYFSQLKETLQTRKGILMKETLVRRYMTAAEYIYLLELRDLKSEFYKLTQREIEILEQKTGSASFDAEDFVEAKMDGIAAESDAIQTEVDLNIKASEIQTKLNSATKPDWRAADFVQVEDIGKLIDNIAPAGTSTGITLAQQSLELARREYHLEKANINVGFLQTEFDNRRVEQNRTPINISFGVVIPVTNPNKGDMAKRKLDMIEAENEIKETSVNQAIAFRLEKDKALQLIQTSNKLQTRITELEQSNLATTLSMMKGGDPLVVNRFQKELISLKVSKAKLRRQILESFIRLLAITDQIQKSPLTNYFSPTLEVIER